MLLECILYFPRLLKQVMNRRVQQQGVHLGVVAASLPIPCILGAGTRSHGPSCYSLTSDVCLPLIRYT